jgi:hypothetical protein
MEAPPQVKDTSFKLIFGHPELFAEFLRDYVPIPLLKTVKAEDIEDVSKRFLSLEIGNKDSDTIKKVRLPGSDTPVYVITILEQQSNVNHRMPFRMLLYIALVLDACEKDANKDKAVTHLKKFLYPPVLPIVFYDGEGNWTAEKNFLYKTQMHEVFEKYIPKFEYLVVNLNTYSKEDILEFSDMLSLIMLVDKVKTPEMFHEMTNIPDSYIDNLRIPDEFKELLIKVMQTLLRRVKVPEDDIEEVTEIIDSGRYKGMFEVLGKNVEKREREVAAQLAQKDSQLAQQRSQIAQQSAEIAELRRQLELR